MPSEVASAFVTLIPSAQGFRKATEAQIGGDLESSGRKGGKKFSAGMAGAVGGVATKIFAPLAAAAAAVSIGGFLKGAVAQASDLQEAGSKVNQIFGEQGATSLNKFASTASTKLGQTRLDVLNAAASFGTFGKAAGLAGPDLAKFSSGLVGLSTDMASFFNTSPAEAAEAISAGLRGEAEPLRKYGVLLDDATLRAEALKQGLIKTTKDALTPQQKVLAAQAVIMKQTADAQGDFSKTSGGLANQQRILSASWSEMKTAIGEKLLPVVTGFVTFLNTSVMPALSKAGGFVSGFVSSVTLGLGGGGSGGVSGAFSGVLAAVKSFAPQVGALMGAVRGYFAAVKPIVMQLVAVFVKNLPAIRATAVQVFTSVMSIVRSAFSIVTSVFRIATKVITTLWNNGFGKAVLGVVNAVFPAILGIIRGSFQIVQGIFKTVAAALKGDWKGAWDGIKNIVSGAKTILVSTVKGLLKAVGAVFAGAGTLLWNAGSALIEGLIDGIKSKLSAVGDAMKGVADKVKGFLPGSPVREGPLMSWNRGAAGARLVELLASGIRDSGPAVQAARSLAADIQDAAGIKPIGVSTFATTRNLGAESSVLAGYSRSFIGAQFTGPIIAADPEEAMRQADRKAAQTWQAVGGRQLMAGIG